MRKTVSLITLDPGSCRSYERQLAALFGDLVDLRHFCMRDHAEPVPQRADLYVVSTDAFDDGERVGDFLPIDRETVEIRLTFTKESLCALSSLPAGAKALFVNLSRKMAVECITKLDQLGVADLEFVPAYPGMDTVPPVPLAVTSGESRFAPPSASTVIDLGPRVLDAATIVEIALKLNLERLLETEPFLEYFESIADNNYSFHRLFGRSMRLESRFEILMGILDEGIVGIDEEGRIFACSPRVETITGHRRGDLVGRPVAEALPYIPIEECVRKHYEIRSRLVRLESGDVGLTLKPVIRGGSYIGAFAVLRSVTDEEREERRLRLQLLDRGYSARYRFEDIVGDSQPIRRARDIAMRLASTSGSILITGESGTGKELFAHSIHNHSPRRDQPFVAVNCAAIPDSLLESELFGYDEGAFTGARKGGKPGLFEFAHRGSLFLDEIEGMSQGLQVKLLRVIQEKEVLRVGGSKVLRVDVRVIAATNEDLEGLVERGAFRKDLYYRLNTLPIQLPPLRERGEDILLLFERMKIELGGRFMLSEEAAEAFRRHVWTGNIRELRNYAEYLSCMDLAVVGYNDLPPALRREPPPRANARPGAGLGSEPALEKLGALGARASDGAALLLALADAGRQKRRVGRANLSATLSGDARYLSEQEVRSLLALLSGLGLVRVARGRAGTMLTSRGASLVQELLGSREA